MSEDRDYGLSDGRHDAEVGKKPQVDLNKRLLDEYEEAYVEGYQRARAEVTEAIR